MDDELLNDYLEEAKDIMERVSSLMDDLSQREPSLADMDELFRAIHTVKGGAGMFGWDNTLNTGHALETYLGECKKDISKFDYDFARGEVDNIETLLESNDNAESISIQEPQEREINDSSSAKSKGSSYCSNLFPEFVSTFAEVLDDQVKNGLRFFEFSVPKKVEEKLLTTLEKYGFEKFSDEIRNDNVDLLISATGEVLENSKELIEKLSKFTSFKEVLRQKEEKATEPESRDEELTIITPREIDKKEGRGTECSTQKKNDVLRVPTENVNDALNSIWEIFLLRNQIAYLFEKNKEFLRSNVDMSQEWEILDNALKRNIAELESTAMSMRMNDLSSLFSRMKKVVRSYQKNSGKNIVFETSGDDIELDKKVIDMLGEPLIHLVRNAMDHGVESPEIRQKAGKAVSGLIKLSAKSMSDKVVIKIQDDGKGIDVNKILEKAKEKGVDTTHIKSEEDAVNLIFSAGFSTAEKVTDVSGRGVGMDAVRRSIQKLGGEVFIETEVGKGSTFNIELPLSMAVISSILFEVNGKSYGSSIDNLVEICRESNNILEENNGSVLFPYRGEYLECFDLREFFKADDREKENSRDVATFCILEVNGKKSAIQVDKVTKHTDIVVKETKGVFPEVDCINGVSILATGEPIFVVSLTKIYRTMREGGANAA